MNRLSCVVWRISLPLIFVEATEALDHLIDSLFLGRVGDTEQGAIAIADAVLLLFLVLPLGLVDAIQVLTARRVGQRKPAAVGRVFDRGLLLVLGVCAAAAVGLKVASPLLAPWCVESDAVGSAVDDYLQLEAYCIPLTAATFAFSALMTSLGRTWVLMPAMALLVTTDVALDYMFVLGGFGCPALGIRGAALGSIGAELVMLGFLVLYTWRQLELERYGLLRFRRSDARTTRLLGRLSLPLAGQLLLSDIGWLLFFLMIERSGEQALAIANVVFTCYMVFWIPAEGFAETSCSMVSRFVGRNRSQRIGRVMRATIGPAILITVPFLAVALVAPEWILAAFASGPESLSEGSASLRVVALTMLIAIPAGMWMGAVVGAGDMTAALGIEGVHVLTMLSLTWLAAIELSWPQELVWLSLPIAWLVVWTLSYGWIASGIWKRILI